MEKPVLLVMAAGMGSRYGGMKQIDPVGQNGELILDYSLYDAKRAGFEKAVFIIKEENEADFRKVLDKGAGRHMEIELVYQTLQNVPQGFEVPEGRVKPFGTGHAVLSAHGSINTPVAVINADDFYGQEAFQKMYDFLSQAKDGAKCDYAMVGFYLKNTVTENGFVSRGVCETKDGYLANIVERTRIERRGTELAYSENDGETWNPLEDNAVVSMNLWGFTPSVFDYLQDGFIRFMKEDVPNNPLKAEFYLPFLINEMLQNGKAQVTVLSSHDKWYGVTYQEDKEEVVAAIQGLSATGQYPAPLWGIS